jgi:hypothetical protein
MYSLIRRILLMTLYMLLAILCCSGQMYDSYGSLMAAALLFGVMSSGVSFLSTVAYLKPYCQKVVFFTLITNIFIILILGKLVPGFHVASSSTAVWLSFLIVLMNGSKHLYSLCKQINSFSQKPKMKLANAKVIRSQKNRLQ